MRVLLFACEWHDCKAFTSVCPRVARAHAIIPNCQYGSRSNCGSYVLVNYTLIECLLLALSSGSSSRHHVKIVWFMANVDTRRRSAVVVTTNSRRFLIEDDEGRWHSMIARLCAKAIVYAPLCSFYPFWGCSGAVEPCDKPRSSPLLKGDMQGAVPPYSYVST
jgi:hypothetical protein